MNAISIPQPKGAKASELPVVQKEIRKKTEDMSFSSYVLQASNFRVLI